MYNMFSEDPNEQELYHATAAVTSLLLEIREVGKLFQPAKEGRGWGAAGPAGHQGLPAACAFPKKGPSQPSCPKQRSPSPQLSQRRWGALPGRTDGGHQAGGLLARDHGACSSMLISSDDTKDDSSMSSYSVLSAGSHGEDKAALCEDIGGGHGPGAQRPRHSGACPESTSLDGTGPSPSNSSWPLWRAGLVKYFDKPVCAWWPGSPVQKTSGWWASPHLHQWLWDLGLVRLNRSTFSGGPRKSEGGRGLFYVLCWGFSLHTQIKYLLVPGLKLCFHNIIQWKAVWRNT